MALQSTDPIADLLTRIRNAIMAGKTEVRVPARAGRKHDEGSFGASIKNSID